MKNLQDKHILVIGIGFYDYENAICEAIRKRGAVVSYFNSARAFVSSRLLRRFRFSFVAEDIEQKYRIEELNKFSDNDMVFIIKGEKLTRLDVDLLKKLNPKARFILYLWDSLVRLSNRDLLLENFDTVYSFDRKDCEENSRLKFRPLFYRTVSPVLPEKYALSFIGWMHSDRFRIVKQLRDKLQNLRQPYYLKLYMGYFSYQLSKTVFRNIKEEDKELIILNPVSYADYQKITAQSRMVLDISHPLQSGLTMRTIETLAQGSCLLTTNEDIVNYPQINKDSYFIMERYKIGLPEGFEEIRRVKQSEDFYYYFSLEGFLDEILEGK